MKEEEEKMLYEGARRGGRSRPQPKSRASVDLPEGVFNQRQDPNDVSSDLFARAVSLTKIRTSDLLSEGEIQGLVTGHYRFTSEEGATGYNTAELVKNKSVTINSESFINLQSVFLNEVPLVDEDGKFNFQQINFTEDKGSPLPSVNATINNPDGQGLSVVRSIGERLRGPNIIVNADGSTDVDPDVSEDTFAKYYRIDNKQCSKAQINIRFNSLFIINKTGPKTNPPDAPAGQGFGDQGSAKVTIRIKIREIFSNSGGYQDSPNFKTVKTKVIEGKLSQGYIQAIPFDTGLSSDLTNDPTFLGFEVKVVRLTADPISRDRSDQTTIDSLIEYYEDTFGYPSSAIVSCKFDAEYFSQAPARTFEVDLLKVKVPSNYDPILRKYTGEWDGTFASKKKWTDNPAWCFYDAITSKRYGLGDQISENFVDKWSLYSIAQYCDEMVPDGEGGYEPRFSCNAYFNERLDAYTFLQDFASIFRGLTYYAGGAVRAFQDRPSDPIYTFTNANVVDGKFSYQSTSRKARFNTAIIRYNDRFNNYLPAVEVVEDIDGVRRNGVIRKELTAVGVTKKSQAARIANWILLTDNLETESISFSAGIEASILEPGDVVRVSDNTKNNRRLAGRIKGIVTGASNNKITLDSEIPLSGNETYEFSLVTPTYQYEPSLMTGALELSGADIADISRSQIQTFSFFGSDTSGETGNDNIVRTVITGATNFGLDSINHEISGFYPYSIFSNGSIDKNEDQLYRVLSITEANKGFDVNGIIYKQEKYGLADEALEIENRAVFAVPPAPTELVLQVNDISTEDTRFKKIDSATTLPDNSLDNIKSVVIYAKKGDWDAADFAQRGGSVTNKTPDSNYIVAITEATQSPVNSAFAPSEDGDYYVRVYSRNPAGTPSEAPVSGQISIDQGPVIESLTISNLTLEELDATDAVREKNETDEVSPSFKWTQTFSLDDADSDINVDLNNVRYRVTVREPSVDSIPTPIIYFEETGLSLEEAVYQFTYAKNLTSVPVIAKNGRVFPQYTNYHFPTEPQTETSEYVKTGFDFFSGQKGPMRNYDLVVEAHDLNGKSSVGYDVSTYTEGSGSNSVYSVGRADGYDILQVRNFGIEQVIFTPDIHSQNCRAAIQASSDVNTITNVFNTPYDPNGQDNVGSVFDDFDFNYPTAVALGAKSNDPTKWCTQQFFSFNGDLEIKFFRDSAGEADFSTMEASNAEAAVVYFADKWFDSQKAKNATYEDDIFGDQTAEITSSKPNDSTQFPFVITPDTPTITTTDITTTVTKRGVYIDTASSINEEKIVIPANIVSKGKYVAVTLLDKFEIKQLKDGTTDQDTLLDNAKNFNVSPASFMKRRGEPDARGAFRAYAQITNAGVAKRVGTAPYRVEGVSISASTFGIAEGSMQIGLIENMPQSVDFNFKTEFARFKIRSSNSSTQSLPTNIIESNAPNLSVKVTFELEEPIPSEGRAVITSNQGNVKRNVTDDQVEILIPVEKFYTAGGLRSLKVSDAVYEGATGNTARAVYRTYMTLNIDVNTERDSHGFVEFIGILWNGISVPNSNTFILDQD